MLKKLKRNAAAQLSLTVFLIISFLMTFYYLAYSRILYKDYTAKAEALSEIHSQNIASYLTQFGKNLSIFLDNSGICDYESVSDFNNSVILRNALSNIMKYRFNEDIYNIAIISRDGEYITLNNYLDIEAIKDSGVIQKLNENPVCTFYNPDDSFFNNETLTSSQRENMFFYGKTIYDSTGASEFYVITALRTKSFVHKLSVEPYFISNASVYIMFDDSYLTVTENSATALSKLSSDGKIQPGRRNGIITTRIHNSDFGFDVVTNISSNDKAILVNSLKWILVFLCVIFGWLGLVFSKKIIEYIISPLEKISIKIGRSNID